MQIIHEITSSDSVKLISMDNLVADMSSDFSEGWKNSIIKFGRTDSLCEDDKQILISFGYALGVTDLSGQTDNCRLHINMLKKQLVSAEEALKSKSRIITTISICCAFVVLIIMS